MRSEKIFKIIFKKGHKKGHKPMKLYFFQMEKMKFQAFADAKLDRMASARSVIVCEFLM